MKNNRVDCNECQNFNVEKIQISKNLLEFSERPKCKLGKRVMFRMPIFASSTSYNAINDYGWIRYCNDFNSISKSD